MARCVYIYTFKLYLIVLDDVLGLEIPDEDAGITTPTNKVAMIVKEATTGEIASILQGKKKKMSDTNRLTRESGTHVLYIECNRVIKGYLKEWQLVSDFLWSRTKKGSSLNHMYYHFPLTLWRRKLQVMMSSRKSHTAILSPHFGTTASLVSRESSVKGGFFCPVTHNIFRVDTYIWWYELPFPSSRKAWAPTFTNFVISVGSMTRLTSVGSCTHNLGHVKFSMQTLV